MQRYRNPAFRKPQCDVLIVGAGLAGLFTALKLAPLPVTVISPDRLGDGASSSWAQGGIAAAIGEGDTPEKHAEDTIRAGAGIVDAAMTNLLVGEAAARIEDLLRYGVPFDKDLEGKLKLSKEAAHGERRIARVRGDMAGHSIMAALISAVRKTPSITILEGYTVKKLGMSGGQISGVHMWPSASSDRKRRLFISSTCVILATGGVGSLYSVTTNPATACGEGLAMALRAGAIAADTEFVQFHPTAIDAGSDPAPLATEALRGEGALLVNGRGERFMKMLHDDAELAPRDIVARAVHREVMSGRGAFLDCRTAIGTKFSAEFPTVYRKCMTLGIDPSQSLIPIAPAAHYHMGGVLTDANGRTSVNGLWACGETASTGTHGANRLASNSLLEAIVFGARISEDIKGLLRNSNRRNVPVSEDNGINSDYNCEPQSILIKKLRSLMFEHVGVIRNHQGLSLALEELTRLDKKAGKNITLKNMILAAKSITVAALNRHESRGAHFRSDYPEPIERFKTRTYLTRKDIEKAVCGISATSNLPSSPDLVAINT